MKKNLLLFVIVLSVSFAAMEMLLHTNYFLHDSRIGVYQLTHEIGETSLFQLTGDLDLPYVARPNVSLKTWWGETISTNEHGFRGDLLTDDKNLNVLVVGDSVAWGLGVKQNETFSDYLREMARGSYPNIKIGNAGAPGYNTRHELTLLRQLLSGSGRSYRYKPDLVIFQYNSNDYITIDRGVQEGNVYNFYVRKSTNTFGAPSWLYQYLLEHSELFFRSNDLLQAYFQGSSALRGYPDWYQYNYQKLKEVKQLADEYGFECLFLIYGHSGQPGDYDKISTFKGIFKHSIDLRKELLEAKDQPIWFDAIHTNTAGHQLIAKRIYEYLIQHDLLKAAQLPPSAMSRE